MRLILDYLPQYVAVNGGQAHGVSNQMTGGCTLPAIAQQGSQWPLRPRCGHTKKWFWMTAVSSIQPQRTCQLLTKSHRSPRYLHEPDAPPDHRRAICRPNAYQGNRKYLQPALRRLKLPTSSGLASGCCLAKRNSCSRSNSSHGSNMVTIGQLTHVAGPSPNHLYWPCLDVALSVDSIRRQGDFPLVSRG